MDNQSGDSPEDVCLPDIISFQKTNLRVILKMYSLSIYAPNQSNEVLVLS